MSQEFATQKLASAEKSRDVLTTIETTLPQHNAKKNFTPLQIVALGFNVSNSWVAVAVSLVVAVAAGGTVTLIYGVIISAIVYAAVALSMAELASAYPTAGGQYHFTSFISPASIKRQASYWCGTITTFSWIALCTAATIIAAQLLLGIVIALRPSYTPAAWHYFLTYQAVNVVVLLYNLFMLKKTLWVHDVGFFLTLAMFIITTITCLALSPKQSSTYVWATFSNATGWDDGICFLTGLVTPCFMYAGLDATMHLAEECEEPRKTVPQALLSTVVIGFAMFQANFFAVSAFIFTVGMCYSITDLDALLTSATPIHELWRQATGSDTAAVVFLIALFATLLFVANAMQQTASHLIWAFGRDDALIFSEHVSRVHPTLEVPVWGLLVNAICVLVTGCLYLASTAAFNALVNSSIVLQMVSFAIPCGIMIIQRRKEAILPSDRLFKLPSWFGWGCNLLVVAFALIEVIFFCFPTALPVSGASMNYTCAIIAVFGIFGAMNWWWHAKKHYHGPTTDFVGV